MHHGKTIGGILLGLSVLLGGCGLEDMQPDGLAVNALTPSSVQGCLDPTRFAEEPELYGTIYHDTVRVCLPYLISLEPHANAQANLHYGDPNPAKNYDPDMTTDPFFAIQFGWWDPQQAGTTTGCGTPGIPQYFANGSTAIESHGHGGANGPPWDWGTGGGGGGGSGNEGHCVRPGTYTFSADGTYDAEFDLDYIQVGHAPNELVQNQSINPPRTEFVELSTYDALETAHDLRVLLDFPLDGTRGSESGTGLQIQNSGSNPQNTVFIDDPNPVPTGTAASWFRFSIGTSNATWFGPDSGTSVSLVRLFWDVADPSNPANRTGYYDMNKYGNPVIRIHRFPNPAQLEKTVTVGLEIKRPDESPAAAPTVTRAVKITRLDTDLDPSISTVSLANSTLTVNLNVKNFPPDPAASEPAGWRAGVYLLSNSGVETPVGLDITEGATIAAGQSVPRTYTVSTQGISPGAYYVVVKLDYNNQRKESNDNNNNETSLTQVTVPGMPDLNAINLSGTPPTIAPGGSLTVNVTMRNLGNAAAPGGWGWRVYLSTDQTLSPGTDVLLKAWGFGPLPAGGSGGFSQAVNLPGSLPNGTYYLIAQLDVTAAVAESNENNNVTVSASPITVQPGLP